ncbi:MAG TPA: MerR family transcriptional regulator [Allocoleopsis sp.]
MKNQNVTERMRIGELAQKAGVTPRTIRYYENLGLLKPSEREGKGFRYYTEAQLAKLHKIDALQSLGLTLEEIGGIIDLFFEEPTMLRGKQKLLEILQAHLQEADEKLEALTQFRSELQANITRIQQWIDEQTKEQ